MKKQIGLFAALCAFIAAASAACAATPEEIAAEVEVGKYVAAQFAREVCFTATPADVQRVFEKLIVGLERPLPYNLKVIKDKNPNAFCIPGGTIYITTGMIKFVRSEDELAAVLSHELVHANRAHLVAQIERGQKVTLAALVAELTGSKKGAARLLNRVAKATADSSASYEMEREADTLSLQILQRAGYSVNAPLSLMENIASKFASASKKSGTHPVIATRIASLKTAISQL